MKTAIIGGGIGGIMTALLMDKKACGGEITIYERSDRIGGRLRFKERDGYKIDEGPTIVLLPNLLREILFEAGFDADALELVRCDPLYALHYEDGSTFYKWSDEERQLAEIGEKFPGEENGYLRYMSDMRAQFNAGKQAFLDQNFLRRRDFFTLSNAKTLLKMHAYESIQKTARRYFSTKLLQEAFSFQTLYIGGNPKRTPALYSLIPYSEHEDGIWYLRGGYARLAELLHDELDRRGISIKLNTPINKVHTNEKHAEALEDDQGQIYEADQVILNGDLPSMHQLFEEKPPKRNYEPSSGCLLIYAGVNDQYVENNIHQFFMSSNLDQHMEDVFSNRSWNQEPSFYIFNPSLIDDRLAPNGKSVLYFLVPAPLDTPLKDEEKYIDQLLQRAERKFPNLRKNIEWLEYKTPEDALLEGLHSGGSFGIAPTYMQSGAFRPQLKPFSYHNVYAVGASVHPGGGIPIVMQGAKLLADYVKQNTEKERLHAYDS